MSALLNGPVNADARRLWQRKCLSSSGSMARLLDEAGQWSRMGRRLGGTRNWIHLSSARLNTHPQCPVRPTLSKKLFPVGRVGKKKSQSGGRESVFFFLISFFMN